MDIDSDKQAMIDQMLAASRAVLVDIDARYESELKDFPTEHLFGILCAFVFSLKDSWSFEHVGVLAAAAVLERYRGSPSMGDYETDFA